MDYILYNKIKDNLTNKYNDIIQNINIDGGFKPFQISTDKILSSVRNMKSIEGLENIPANLQEYKSRLEYLISKVDDKLKQYNDNNFEDKMKIGNNIGNLLQNPKFKSVLDAYNDSIKQELWNGERINKEVYANNELEMNNIYLKSAKEDLVDFNRQLLLLFNPYISNFDQVNKSPEQSRLLNDNLLQEIKKLQELIEIANQFNNYIDEKRKVIDDVMKVEYDSKDIAFVDNTNKTILESEFVQELREARVPKESQLNLQSINDIEIIINNTIDRIKVDDEMSKLKEFNIINKTDDLSKILDLSDVVKINKQSGGADSVAAISDDAENADDRDLNNNYVVTEETNKNLFKLLKLFEQLCSLIENIIDDSKYLKELKYRYNFHMAFLFMIIKQSASKDTIVIYNYLSKDKIKLYLMILGKIMNKFSNLSSTDVNTSYLNKYHYLNIEKIINILNYLSDKFPSDNHLVNVNACKNKVLNDLTIFNHFRSILIKYVNTAEGKQVTELENSDLL